MYRYGDATPFPLDENFIDTLTAVTEACVALFHADVDAESRRRKAHEVREHANEELKRLDALSAAIEQTLKPHLPSAKPSRASHVAAGRIVGNARNAIKTARAGVSKRRETAVRLAFGDQLGVQVLDALSSFALSHQLPKTKWTIRWSHSLASGKATTAMEAIAPCSLATTFLATVPDSYLWSTAFQVGQLEPGLTLELQKQGGWLRKGPKLATQPLHKYYVTEVELAPDYAMFILRKSDKKPSPGYKVVMRDEDDGAPTLSPIEPNSTKPGDTLVLSGDSAVSLTSLWNKMERDLFQLRSHRSNMVSATFNDEAIDKLSEPGLVAEAMLSAVAPIIREMRLRSRVPGELVLKRDTGDGRREELFVPRRMLESKYSTLPGKHQRLFESVGIGGEATFEFVRREFPMTGGEATAKPVKKLPPAPPRKAPVSGPNAPTMGPGPQPAVAVKGVARAVPPPPPEPPPLPTIELTPDAITAKRMDSEAETGTDHRAAVA